MANGSYAEHRQLEAELADFYDVPYAMVFSTGYAANLGTLCALLGPGDAVLLDADAHASLYDGCQMSGADVYRFKHNDADSLDKRLRRLGDRAKRCLIITEGMYSVLGDCAPIRHIVELKNQYGAYLLIDEAHSLGVFGERGCGLAEALGLLDQVDFVVGTFSKSLGATGGYCVSPHEQLQRFCYSSRPYIFTASPSPAVIATTRAALRHLRAHPELRERLWANADRLYQGLRQLELPLGPESSPVVAVRLQNREQALDVWRGLLDAGVYTNLILPPASPEGGSFLRCSMTAAHSDEQIDAIIDAFEGLKRFFT
jgi:8-amino-7-oxononanoate synthase